MVAINSHANAKAVDRTANVTTGKPDTAGKPDVTGVSLALTKAPEQAQASLQKALDSQA
jgi:hypothetical protein